MEKRAVRQMKAAAVIAGIILSVFSAPSFCFSQNQALAPVLISITTPEQLAQWFLTDFRYETEMPDTWQNASETLEIKKGDCEDFAILAQDMLNKMGIQSDILIIKFTGLNQQHAICIFKEGDNYSFISNQELIRTGAATLKEAIQEQYSDWESITFTNAKKDILNLVLNNGLPATAASCIDTASQNKNLPLTK